MVIEDHTNCDETIAELKQTILERDETIINLNQLMLFLRKRLKAMIKQLELEQKESAWIFAKWAALHMGSRNQDGISGRR
jgi:signal-transduction protein with cAMP-binding, CBS, and nucleotidyltransferase domain